MKVVVHQAIYGEQNRGHALLVKSSPGTDLFDDLIGLTDLPGNLATGTQWRPYLSCFPFGEYYVVSRTFPDLDSPRAGMVLTHALAVKTEDIAKLDDIGSIIDLLLKNPERKPQVDPVQLEISDVSSRSVKVQASSQFRNLVHALIYRNESQPAVWVGYDGFDDAVKQLWNLLWAKARVKFSCRVSFGPQDVEGQHLTLVVTPSDLQYRWGGYRLIRNTDEPTDDTDATAYFLDSLVPSALGKFIDELGVSLSSIRDLQLVERTHRLWQSLSSSKNADEVRMLTRFLGELSPSKDIGVTQKREALSKLAELTAIGNSQDIKALRNFDYAPFIDGKVIVQSSFQQWLRNRIKFRPSGNSKEEADLIEMALDSVDSEWNQMMQAAVRNVLGKWEREAAIRIWEWWDGSANLVESLASLIPANAESDLLDTAPSNTSESLARAVLPIAARNSWLALHAAMSASYGSTHEAVERQLAIDESTTFSRTASAFLRLPLRELIDEALVRKDIRLWKLTGNACAKESDLLAGIDINELEWREIWLAAIQTSGNTWIGINDPSSVVYTLMDVMLRGEPVSEDLLARVGATSNADLTDYASRSAVWRHLPLAVKGDFLDSTAEGWLDRFELNAEFNPNVESELVECVLQQARLERRLYPLQPKSITFAVNVFKRFSSLNESHFRRWLGRIATERVGIDVGNSVLIGRVIVSRRWRGAATALFTVVNKERRSDLIPSLRECHHLLDWWDSILFRWSGYLSGYHLTWEDWWGAFTETAVELYPRGPDEMKIWARAGGDGSAIIANVPGRESWQHAIQTLRNGGGVTGSQQRHL